MQKVKCPICETEINDEPFSSFCPKCNWGYSGMEKFYAEGERDDYNLISRKDAKLLFKKGLNKFGEPIEKTKHT